MTLFVVVVVVVIVNENKLKNETFLFKRRLMVLCAVCYIPYIAHLLFIRKIRATIDVIVEPLMT